MPSIIHSGIWLGLLLSVVILAIVYPKYVFPLLPLIIVVSIILRYWKITLSVGLAIVAIQAGLVGYYGKDVSAAPLIPILVTILTVGMSVWLCRWLSAEIYARQALEEKLQNRSDKYLMRAHEIRTPLALIRASVELILDGAPGPITPQQQIFLENIDENSQHIALLAENMLTKGKLESGIFQPTFQPTDIRDPIREVVADMRTFTERRGQTIRTHYPQILPYVDVDPVLLRQAIVNLIQNAIRHTSAGGQIIVSVVENDLSLLISVTDDGAGMTAEQRHQLFSRFVSGSGGTGLGLLIVKQIIELSGGKVMVDTSLGRGTTFFLTLPFSTRTMANIT